MCNHGNKKKSIHKERRLLLFYVLLIKLPTRVVLDGQCASNSYLWNCTYAKNVAWHRMLLSILREFLF